MSSATLRARSLIRPDRPHSRQQPQRGSRQRCADGVAALQSAARKQPAGRRRTPTEAGPPAGACGSVGAAPIAGPSRQRKCILRMQRNAAFRPAEHRSQNPLARPGRTFGRQPCAARCPPLQACQALSSSSTSASLAARSLLCSGGPQKPRLEGL